MKAIRKHNPTYDVAQWKKHGDHPQVHEWQGRRSTLTDLGTEFVFAGDGDLLPVNPTDWIVTDEDGNTAVYSNDRFHAEFTLGATPAFVDLDDVASTVCNLLCFRDFSPNDILAIDEAIRFYSKEGATHE